MKIKIGETCFHKEEDRYARAFNKHAYDVIDRLSYNFYLINVHKDDYCTCYNFDTKQGNKACKKCLGRGRRITIREAEGASMNTKLGSSQREVKDVVVGSIYYIKEDIKVNKDDLIIDDDNVFLVSQIRMTKSFNGKHKYNKLLCVHLKHDSNLILSNFFEVLEKHRRIKNV